MSNSRKALLHPAADLLLMGGASLLFTGLLAIFRVNTTWINTHLWQLLFLFSYPHFISTYPIFYGPRGPWRRHPIIAVAFPVVLAIVLAVGVFVASDQVIKGAAQLTLVLVFWHFIKQAFGTAVFLGTVPGEPLSKAKRELLLFALLLFGCYGYLAVQSETGPVNVFGVQLQPLQFIDTVVRTGRWAAYGSMGALLAWIAYDRLRGKPTGFSWQGWIPVAAVATWFEPSLGGSPTQLILPVFHAIQYMPFPVRVQLNEERPAPGATHPWLRRGFIWVACLALGFVFFSALPMGAGYVVGGRPALRVFAFVQIFFNLHHYMMDAVLWKFSDAQVRARLFATPSAQISNT